MKYRIKISLAIMISVLLTLGAAGYSLMPDGDKVNANNYYPTFLQGEINTLEEISGETAAHKNETVYVLLDNQGQVLEQNIVNRIYGLEDHDAGLVVDYGHYSKLTNMLSSELPLIDNDKITWPSSLIKQNDLYYTGRVEELLPVSVEIKYLLNGEAHSPEELPGKSGRLDLVFTFTNNLQYPEKLSYYDYDQNLIYSEDPNYVPFLVQGTLDLDLNRFTDIDPGEGVVLVMGQVASVNFMTFPYPESEVIISMTGDNIELDRVNMMAVPQLPAFPEIDLEEILVKMLEGVQLFSAAFGEISSGADQLLLAMNRLQTESDHLTGDSMDIIDLLKQYEEEEETFRRLLEGNEYRALVEQLKELEVLLSRIEGIPGSSSPAAAINDSIAGIAEAQEDINNSRRIMVILDNSSGLIIQEAQQLTALHPPGSIEHELALQIIEREALLKEAISENNQAADLLAENIEDLQKFQEMWLSEYQPGLEAIEELQGLMSTSDINYWLSLLTQELENIDAYYEEAESLITEAKSLLENLEQLPLAMKYLSEGQTALVEGLNALGSEGLGSMEEELIKGINEAKEGNAKLELMKKLADDYRSYADNLHNRHSDVRFILQSNRLVEKQDEINDEENAEQENDLVWTEQIWQKLVGLFQ